MNKVKLSLATLGLVLFLSGCNYTPYMQFSHNAIYLNDKDTTNILKLQNPRKVYRFDSCVFNGFTIDDKNTHIEYIKLHSWCQWNGLSSSFYQNFLNLNIKKLQLIKSFTKDKYNIFLYAKDGKEFYFVHTYDVSSDLLIIDYDGSFVVSICDECYLLDKSIQFDERIDISLIDRNFFEGYFSRESNDDEYYKK
ncbi:MAG: hypothetical protein RBR07_10275 [Arcobacteraceae bacterium]|nr:hypothetical protein [Arcobacteraceae bacterium]